ncbi:hypothetical protein FH972_006212 [Carpinus fangiana]|uniref:Uncharacterized protein n=1 Tax=Carpinus fangiana TaxID=176857 RepID=A0A5N6QUV2_9ROSI|nr:hypothetical protein FH972_006212 [Carpinus fangiana]
MPLHHLGLDLRRRHGRQIGGHFCPYFFLGFIQAIGCLGVVGFEKAEGGDLHDEEEGLPADDRTAVDGCVAIENVGVLGGLMCVEMFFFPFVGGGHQIPMIDTARVFAPHGAKSTITATPNSAPLFQNSILRDQQIGRQISIHALRLPEGAVPPDADMSATGFTDTSILQEPLRLFLLDRRPDCIVVDLFLGWAAKLIDGLRIRRVFFTGLDEHWVSDQCLWGFEFGERRNPRIFRC